MGRVTDGRRRPPPFGRRVGFSAGLAALALLASVAAGEAALRVLYRDRGRTTLGGPGGMPFQYTFNAIGRGEEPRFPEPSGAKTPGVTRLAIQGDSITWGVGVKDWAALYANRLIRRLQADGCDCDLVVRAGPGFNIDGHADRLPELVAEYAPDVVVYQWYVNDLDVGIRSPVPPRPWQTWPYHRAWRASSFLYFFLDNRLDRLLGQPYLRHLRDDFAEGTLPWAEFRESFHRWATWASARVPRTIVLLYPQVPFGKQNPLADLHRRMTSLVTGTTRLEFPPSFQREARADAAAMIGPEEPAATEHVVSGSSRIPMLPGHYDVDVEVHLARSAPHSGHVLILQDNGARVLANREIPADTVGKWVHVLVPFDVADRPMTENVEFIVTAGDDVEVEVGTIGLDVRYPNLEVLDPTDILNTFDTHVSIFDAHPNERAQGVLAQLLYERLRGAWPATPRAR